MMKGISHLHLSDTERMFAARLDDLTRMAEERGMTRFSAFMDERQQEIAHAVCDGKDCQTRFYGGWEHAERVMLGAVPSFLSLSERDFPIEAVTIRFPKGFSIAHRDVLGTLLSLKVKREAVGDILVGDTFAVAFVSEQVISLILQEITKIGGVGVECERGTPPGTLPDAHRVEPSEGIVSSMRMDCLVALLTGTNRSDAQRMIRSGLVQQNARLVESVSREGIEGDRISIRGTGKFELGAVGSMTGKGRLHIAFTKFI